MRTWEQVWALVSRVPGWLGEAQAEILWKLAAPARVVVELGSWKGRSALALALGVRPGAQVWSVDLFHGSADERLPGGPQEEVLGLPGGTLPDFARNLDQYLGDPVRVIVADHVEAAAAFALPVDLLFVDGEHTIQATVATFRAWAPRLAPGAVVVFHDLQMPTVRAAIACGLNLQVEEIAYLGIWRSAR